MSSPPLEIESPSGARARPPRRRLGLALAAAMGVLVAWLLGLGRAPQEDGRARGPRPAGESAWAALLADGARILGGGPGGPQDAPPADGIARRDLERDERAADARVPPAGPRTSEPPATTGDPVTGSTDASAAGEGAPASPGVIFAREETPHTLSVLLATPRGDWIQGGQATVTLIDPEALAGHDPPEGHRAFAATHLSVQENGRVDVAFPSRLLGPVVVRAVLHGLRPSALQGADEGDGEDPPGWRRDLPDPAHEHVRIDLGPVLCTLAAGANGPIVLLEEERPGLTVRVVDAASRPVTGAVVHVADLVGGRETSLLARHRTDAEGVARFPAGLVPQWLPRALDVEDPAMGAMAHRVISPDPSVTEVVRLPGVDLADLSLRFIGEGGAPVETSALIGVEPAPASAADPPSRFAHRMASVEKRREWSTRLPPGRYRVVTCVQAFVQERVVDVRAGAVMVLPWVVAPAGELIVRGRLVPAGGDAPPLGSPAVIHDPVPAGHGHAEDAVEGSWEHAPRVEPPSTPLPFADALRLRGVGEVYLEARGRPGADPPSIWRYARVSLRAGERREEVISFEVPRPPPAPAGAALPPPTEDGAVVAGGVVVSAPVDPEDPAPGAPVPEETLPPESVPPERGAEAASAADGSPSGDEGDLRPEEGSAPADPGTTWVPPSAPPLRMARLHVLLIDDGGRLVPGFARIELGADLFYNSLERDADGTPRLHLPLGFEAPSVGPDEAVLLRGVVARRLPGPPIALRTVAGASQAVVLRAGPLPSEAPSPSLLVRVPNAASWRRHHLRLEVRPANDWSSAAEAIVPASGEVEVRGLVAGVAYRCAVTRLRRIDGRPEGVAFEAEGRAGAPGRAGEVTVEVPLAATLIVRVLDLDTVGAESLAGHGDAAAFTPPRLQLAAGGEDTLALDVVPGPHQVTVHRRGGRLHQRVEVAAGEVRELPRGAWHAVPE